MPLADRPTARRHVHRHVCRPARRHVGRWLARWRDRDRGRVLIDQRLPLAALPGHSRAGVAWLDVLETSAQRVLVVVACAAMAVLAGQAATWLPAAVHEWQVDYQLGVAEQAVVDQARLLAADPDVDAGDALVASAGTVGRAEARDGWVWVVAGDACRLLQADLDEDGALVVRARDGWLTSATCVAH